MKTEYLIFETINDLSNFVNAASNVAGEVTVSRGKYIVDGKSILGVLSIDPSQGFAVTYPEDASAFKDFISNFIKH